MGTTLKRSTPAVARVLTSGQLLATAVQRIQARATQLARQQDSLRMLRRVSRVISREGYNHSLAALISTKDFTKIAPQFPSLESLGSVPVSASDRRVQNGLVRLRTLIAQEEQLVAEQISDAAAAIDDALQAAATQAVGFRELIDALERRLENGVVSDEALQSTTVTAIGADMRSDILGHLIDLTKAIDIPNYDTEAEGLAEQIEGHLAAMVTAIGPSTGAIVEGFTITVDPAKIGEEYTPTEGTLAEKGYTAETVRGLLERTEELIAALVELSEKRALLVEHLNSVAATVADDDGGPAGESFGGEAGEEGEDESGEGEGAEPGEDDPFALPEDGEPEADPLTMGDDAGGDDPLVLPDEDGAQDAPEASPDIGDAAAMKKPRAATSGFELLFMDDDVNGDDANPDIESTDTTTDPSASKPDELGDIAAEELDDADRGTENGRAAIGAFLSLLSLVLQQATGTIASTVAVAAEVVALIGTVPEAATGGVGSDEASDAAYEPDDEVEELA